MNDAPLRLVAHTYPISIISGHETERSTLLMHWSEEDPAAVALTIENPWSSDPQDEVIEWVISRSLMTVACMPQFRDVEIGFADVVVRHRGSTATIRLASAEGSCTLAMRGEVLLDFLKLVSKKMPFGCDEESEIYARQIDAEWAAMAADGAA